MVVVFTVPPSAHSKRRSSSLAEGGESNAMDNNDPLSIPETARRLNVSENVVRKALLRGELRGFKIGRSWRIAPRSVDQKLACEQPGPKADEA
jgi:excisionase family DNA binding protein